MSSNNNKNNNKNHHNDIKKKSLVSVTYFNSKIKHSFYYLHNILHCIKEITTLYITFEIF